MIYMISIWYIVVFLDLVVFLHDRGKLEEMMVISSKNHDFPQQKGRLIWFWSPMFCWRPMFWTCPQNSSWWFQFRSERRPILPWILPWNTSSTVNKNRIMMRCQTWNEMFNPRLHKCSSPTLGTDSFPSLLRYVVDVESTAPSSHSQTLV